MESAQRVPSALERLPFNNTVLKKIPVDDSDQPGSRTVPAACFSLIPVLQPLVRPVFVALSQSALSLIGLCAQEVLSDPLGPEYLSGSRLLPGSEPAAHCYSGHQFGLFVGQLGDGAVMYLGEVESCAHGRWEIQVKGAGVTPYSRDGDGRKVLRSSIREFLCSEAMAALGIPSTRAASLVTSDLYVSRDPLNNGHRIRERCSVVLRLAPSFIRFGSFEIFLGRDEFSGLQGPSAGQNDIRAQLLDYVVETFFPDIQQAHSIRKDRNLAVFREVMVRTARLVAQWQCVGFCHGVLNTDNMSILGLTLDYGPFGFMDRFDPDFVSNASDKKRRYSYQAQPSVCRWNLARLSEALGSELNAAEAGGVLDEFMPTYEAFYLSIMRKKLGLVRKEEAEDSELISDLLHVMYNTGADFTNTFRLLSRVPWPEEGNCELATVGPVVDLILEQCASIEELKVANKPTMDDRELAMILSLAQTNPVMFGLVTDSPGVAQQLELMGRLKELLETDQDELKRKQRGDWIHWISRYRRRLTNKQIRTVLTLGIPGMGKTVCAQKFTLSWAEGEENQDITYLFPLPFRELNTIIDEKNYSLMQLIHQFFPEIKPLEKLGTECKVLFIFDGLDETLLPLKHNKVLRDETEPASLDVLITNLITGDLLSNALIWITSRPAAANRIPRKHIHQWTEVKGFGNDQREEYFKRSLRDDSFALRVINHVKSSRSLYIMCQIPIFCWITVTVMKKMVRNNMTGVIPNTLTEMYAYLLICQTDRMVERHDRLKSDDVILKLGELAFRQLEKGKLIFYEADLKECGMDVTEATIYSGVCTEIFMMEGERRRKIFSFVHLTIQEFLAAVHVHYSYMQRKDNVFLRYLKRIFTRWLPKSVFNLHKTAIEKALESRDGRWDFFLRFLLGLSLKSNQDLLCKILDLDAEGEGEEDVERTIQFIKEKINDEAETKLNLFHCLSELKEEALVQEVQSFVRSGMFNAKKISPAQWSALTFELMTLESTEEEFDLKKYIRSEEGMMKLLMVITSSKRALLNCCNLTENCCRDLASALSSTSSHLTVLDLSENRLRDSGVKLLSAGLNSPNCKLKSLSLKKCQLQGDCCEALAVAVSTEFTQLRDLDLSANDFQSSHLKALCAGMCSPHCKLETLRLNQCKLREGSCEDLASVLNSGSSLLKTLDLSNNSLKDSGVSLLAAGLRNPQCGLETLSFSWCSLTQKCCDPIGSALSSDSTHLTELNLSGNNLDGPDFQLLCSGLRSQNCKLKTLRLDECNLQKCYGDVASVLSSDSSHLKELDLSGNDLQDLEVKLLSNGLANPSCTLETLRLSFCGVTEVGCTHLASALSSNSSHLRELDLSYNYLQDSGVKLISVHGGKLKKLSVDPNAECFLKATLKNYPCTLTLDQNTASKSLFLHDGGQQVSWVRERQEHPDHPERFESVSQVLCQQGLSQRHYWEVEWRGCWVDVAVAKRGISRRAGSHLSGFGYTDQSWSLYCSDDHYTAEHDNHKVEIPAPPFHSNRVGVFLDWPGGTLSFYSVFSGTLRHIHTFYSNFTEPLFPGFGMERDDCSVIIVQ